VEWLPPAAAAGVLAAEPALPALRGDAIPIAAVSAFDGMLCDRDAAEAVLARDNDSRGEALPKDDRVAPAPGEAGLLGAVPVPAPIVARSSMARVPRTATRGLVPFSVPPLDTRFFTATDATTDGAAAAAAGVASFGTTASLLPPPMMPLPPSTGGTTSGGGISAIVWLLLLLLLFHRGTKN